MEPQFKFWVGQKANETLLKKNVITKLKSNIMRKFILIATSQLKQVRRIKKELRNITISNKIKQM